MKSLMADMINRKQSGIKTEAEKSKSLLAKNKNTQKQHQVKEVVSEQKTVMKESKTLMID